MNYTDEQKAILEESGNCVILAAPGSGKTATITAMVKAKLDTLRSHKGAIAISYTNKASTELRQRIRSGGTDTKSSFFGTIDKFFISEIVVPFGRHLWGVPRKELQTLKAEELNAVYAKAGSDVRYEPSVLLKDVDVLGKLYQHGVIVLESVGFLAYHILQESNACRRYLQARYTDIVIDEYQDCGEWQHLFFLSLVGLGLRGIAVGDLDQSIFSWADKHPRFLRTLATNESFATYQLTENHRCHPSIAQYATTFLSGEQNRPVPSDLRVFHATVEGAEREIGDWLSQAVPKIETRFQVETRNKIAVLTRLSRTAEFVRDSLELPHHYALATELDDESTPACRAFKGTLHWLFGVKETRRGFVSEMLDPFTPQIVQRRLVHLLSELQQEVPFDESSIPQITRLFVQIAEIVTGKTVTQRDGRKLHAVLESGRWINYMPAYSHQIQLMTIHKSKGLEFDVVIHLDLYDDVLPFRRRVADADEINLHYVALTRAKAACIICTAPFRYDGSELVRALPSPYFDRPELGALRRAWPEPETIQARG